MAPFELDAPLGRTLREQVLAKLRDAIVRGDLAPGEPLRQDQLAEWLGVSSTPVREAIADLASEQLVDLEPNRGARVRPLTRKTSLDFVRTYRLLFEAGYAWGLPKLTDRDYKAVDEHITALANCCSNADYGSAFDLDASVHDVVFNAAANKDLRDLLVSLRPRIHRLINLHMPTSVWDDNPSAYRHLFDAAKSGDYARASEFLSRTWDRWQDLVSASVPEEAPASG